MHHIYNQGTGSIQEGPLGAIDQAHREENRSYHNDQILEKLHESGIYSPSEKKFNEIFTPETYDLTPEHNALYEGIMKGIKECEDNPFTGKERLPKEVLSLLIVNEHNLKIPDKYGKIIIDEAARVSALNINWRKAVREENQFNAGVPNEDVDIEMAQSVWQNIEGVVEKGIKEKVGVSETDSNAEVEGRTKAVMNILRKHIVNTEYNLEIGERESTIKAIRGAIISGESDITRQGLKDTLDYLSISIFDLFPAAKNEFMRIKDTNKMTEKYNETKESLFDQIEILMSMSRNGLPSNRPDLYPNISGEEFKDIAKELVIDFVGKDYQLGLADNYNYIATQSLRNAGKRTGEADIAIFKRSRIRNTLAQFVIAGFFGNHNEDGNSKARREASGIVI